MQESVTFPSGTTDYIFLNEGGHGVSVFEDFLLSHNGKQIVVITNEDLRALYGHLLQGYPILTVPAHEAGKELHTIALLAKQLLQLEATRSTVLIGLGGGVVTDIVGFLAAVYMRGVAFGFVPTSLLGMVDAAIGGKNGVNVGLNKNILGTVHQPKFIVYDTAFLHTLPEGEWSNGFAEIIKYACIFDEALFAELEQHTIIYYQQNEAALSALIARCVGWKNKTVLADELETGVRKLLNFGHTAGHALENLYELPHGKAVAIGIVIACAVSEQVAGLDSSTTRRVKKLLQQYNLPIGMDMDVPQVMGLLRMDKKRKGDMIDYIVLQQRGAATIKALPLATIENVLSIYASNNQPGIY